MPTVFDNNHMEMNGIGPNFCADGWGWV